MIKKHVDIGYNLIADSALPIVAKNIIRYHHEKWNGEGYNYGLKEEEIPIEARIVAISDVFDAMTSVRVYKEQYSISKTLYIMNEEKGKHFDPFLMDVFKNNFKEIKYLKEINN